MLCANYAFANTQLPVGTYFKPCHLAQPLRDHRTALCDFNIPAGMLIGGPIITIRLIDMSDQNKEPRQFDLGHTPPLELFFMHLEDCYKWE